MRLTRRSSIALWVAIGVVLATPGTAQQTQGQADTKSAHVMVTPDAVKWGPAPPGLPPGSHAAVLEGDPAVAGALFVIRAKLPDGYTVPPHWHPTDEHVTVIRGTLILGHGEKLDAAAGTMLGAGGYAKLPKEMRHFAIAKGETEIQIHGMGPFAITYVNPNDDPRRKTSSQQ